MELPKTDAKLFQVLVVLAVAFGGLVSPRYQFAQGTVTGGFTGKVVDKTTGQPIENATVTLFNESNDTMFSTVTNSEGEFLKKSLQPGNYIIKVSAPNYSSEERVQTLFAMANYVIRGFNPLELTPSNASCEGTVYDRNTEKALSNARVTLRHSADGTATSITTDADGRFATGSLKPGEYAFEFSAQNYTPREIQKTLIAGKTTTVGLGSGLVFLTPAIKQEGETLSLPPELAVGNYYALIIGNDKYSGKIKPLRNAVNDAVAVAKILKEKYGFRTTLLTNAKGADIVRAINFYKGLTEDDKFLIYYSGHGTKEADEAFWVPVDATDGVDSTTWVSTSGDILRNLKVIKARQALVISDSCFAGAIDRQLTQSESAPSTVREKYLKSMVEKPSRTLIASGGDQPVMDGGGGKHSLFTRALLTGLESMTSSVYTATELFNIHIAQQVAGNSEQTPELKNLRNSGHQQGTFVFVRKMP